MAEDTRGGKRRWLIAGLLLVLLALLFAGLALQGRVQDLVAETARLHVIVLDLSASMGHGDRWSRAQDLAESVIDGLETTDVAQVVTAGRVIAYSARPASTSALR